MDVLAQSYSENQDATNQALGSWTSRIALGGLGLAMGKGGTIANSLGTVTLFQAIRSIPYGGVAVSGSIAGSFYSAGLTMAVGYYGTKAALAIGTSAGSLAVATGDALANAITNSVNCP